MNKKYKQFFDYIIILFLLFNSYLISSCGKKGDPTLKSYEKPESPVNLRAIHRESEIILMWDFPKDKEDTIKAFHLMKSNNNGFKRIAIVEKQKRSYKDTNFEIGKEYKYRLYSQNLKGIFSSESNTLSVIPLENPPPPSKISYEIKNGSLIIKWEIVDKDVFYNIYKSHKKGNYGLIPVNNEPLQKPFFKDTLDINRIVYYTIRSFRGGDVRDEGKVSEEIKVDPSELIPSKPEGLQAITKDKAVYLLWKEPPEPWVLGYNIYRKTESDKSYILIGQTQIPTFVDKDIPLTLRSYRVTAFGPVKESPFVEIKDIIFTPYK